MIVTILAFILVFGILVFVHELGHFLAARYFGVEVQEFAFGFGPSIWQKKKGKITYKVNWVPLGGYVRLLGEDWQESKSKANLMNKKPWQQIVILAAGVFMNFVLAWVLLSSFYLFGGQALISDMGKLPGVTNSQKVYITDVAKDTPAAESGLENGDQIAKVNGQEIFSDQEVFAAVQSNGDVVTFTINRNGNVFDKNIKTYTETTDQNGKQVQYKRIGITMESKGKIQAVWYMAPVAGFLEVTQVTKLTAVGFWDFIRTAFTQFKLSAGVGGPIAIAEYSGVAARLGFGILIQFIAVLSISLGVINLVPFPAVDGGHIAIVLFEWISKRRVPAKIREAITLVGFGLLLLLAIVVTIGDLGRFGIFDWIKGVFK